MSRVLATKQAAGRLGLRPTTLPVYRSRGVGPAFVKVGWYVRYREEDLDSYVAARRFASTAEAHRLIDRASGPPPEAEVRP